MAHVSVNRYVHPTDVVEAFLTHQSTPLIDTEMAYYRSSAGSSKALPSPSSPDMLSVPWPSMINPSAMASDCVMIRYCCNLVDGYGCEWTAQILYVD